MSLVRHTKVSSQGEVVPDILPEPNNTSQIIRQLRVPLATLACVLILIVVQLTSLTFESSSTPLNVSNIQLKTLLVTNSSSTSKKFDRFDKFAFALKTGFETALPRTPIQLVSFMRHVNNFIMIAGVPGMSIGPHEIIDVFSDLYTELDEKAKVKRGKQLVPDGNSIGWKTDAHKNLPGFKLLYQKYPESDWFVMIDDDTYVFLDNLEYQLKDLNPNDDHYIGAPRVFVGCDNVKNFGEGPLFAHGGSGIVISRGAMKKMYAILDKCISKYRDCWAGDVRTGLCLRDAGILVAGRQGFNEQPPNDEFDFNDRCFRPATFHHLLQEQVQDLASLENAMNESPITHADIYRSVFSKTTDALEKDTDRNGSDYKQIPLSKPEECRVACLADKKCVAYSWEDNECYLKDSIPKPTLKPGIFSGAVVSHVVCNTQ